MTSSSPDRGTILVTPRSLTRDGADSPYFAPLRDAGYRVVTSAAGRSPSPADLRELLPDVVGWIAGVEPIGVDILDAARRLRVISRNGTGTDSIDLHAASNRGIVVLRASGANAQGVAELAVTLGLTALRAVPWSSDSVKTGGWDRTLGRELAETTVGVIGLGAIGGEVARIFALLGATVRGHDPYAAGSPFAADSVDAVFTQADIVSLHAPAPADGRPIVTEHLLRSMRPAGILVNTARSALVDDDAVLRCLDDGALSAYAVDAFDSEPPELSPLLRHPRVIATPHIGGFTGASVRRATEAAVANLLRELAPLKESI